MNDFIKVLKKLIFIPVWLMILLSAVSGAALISAFAFLGSEHPLSYAIYVLSAYTMTAICFRIPNIVRWIKKFTETNRLASSLKNDAHLRIKLSLGGALAFNAVYAVFQLALGIASSSVWFYSLAAYYFLLAFLRVFMLNHTMNFEPGQKMFREWLIYRFCGLGLVLMNLALTVIIAFVTARGSSSVNGEIITITLAAFTFTAITIAIVNVIRYRQYHSPVWSASKALSFVSALVSVLTLEDAMLATFGQAEGEGFRRLMSALTGAGIVAAVLAIAIYMIVSSTKTIKTFDNKNPLQ